MTGKRCVPVLVLLTLLPSLSQADPFGDHWHDGKAELDGYRYRVERYGERREGTAVMIFVTEPLSETSRVKVDDPSIHPQDAVDALKLNFVRDFQTGIYDYNTMISAFVRTRDMSPLKVSFSSAEWCGHVFQDMRFDAGRVSGRYHSYFEGESGVIDLPHPVGGVSEDMLFIVLRGLRGEFLAPGEARTVPFLPGAFVSRLRHRPQVWGEAILRRAPEPAEVTVPAGTFLASTLEIETGDRRGTVDVEVAYPHRILRWNLPPDSGELTGTLRVPYWNLHGNGQEAYLEELGVAPR